MSSLYWKWDNALTPERCQEIIDSASDTFETAVIGNENRAEDKTRKTNIH